MPAATSSWREAPLAAKAVCGSVGWVGRAGLGMLELLNQHITAA